MTFASRIASQKAQRGNGQGCLSEVWQPTVYVHDTKIYLLVSFVTPRGIEGNLSQASDSDGSLGSVNQAHGSATEAQLMEQPTSPESREITMAEGDPMSLTDYPVVPHASENLYPFDNAEVPNHNACYALPLQDIRTQETYGLTERQAFLFMTYVHKLAPLVSMVCHITTISNKPVRRL